MALSDACFDFCTQLRMLLMNLRAECITTPTQRTLLSMGRKLTRFDEPALPWHRLLTTQNLERAYFDSLLRSWPTTMFRLSQNGPAPSTAK
jgi:hypothetical protein